MAKLRRQINELLGKGMQTEQLFLTERLPSFIAEPCHLTLHYRLVQEEDDCLLDWLNEGQVTITCQSCMGDFFYPFCVKLSMVVRQQEPLEEVVLNSSKEYIVIERGALDLVALATDDLHLYITPYHQDRKDCKSEIKGE